MTSLQGELFCREPFFSISETSGWLDQAVDAEACVPSPGIPAPPSRPAPVQRPSPGQTSPVARGAGPAHGPLGPPECCSRSQGLPGTQTALHQPGLSRVQAGLRCAATGKAPSSQRRPLGLGKGCLARSGYLFQPCALFKARTSPLQTKFQLLLNPRKTCQLGPLVWQERLHQRDWAPSAAPSRDSGWSPVTSGPPRPG